MLDDRGGRVGRSGGGIPPHGAREGRDRRRALGERDRRAQGRRGRSEGTQPGGSVVLAGALPEPDRRTGGGARNGRKTAARVPVKPVAPLRAVAPPRDRPEAES